MKTTDVIIIGAGPAGLLAAIAAGQKGQSVLVLEKKPSPGRKLLITGSGRCNVTNSAPISEFIKRVNPNGKYIKKAFSKFYNKDIVTLLAKHDVKLFEQEGGRLFPVSNSSKDVLNALLKECEQLGVEIRCKAVVEKLITKEQHITGVIVNNTAVLAPKVIIATGGLSYPVTGCTGDGYRMAAENGHTIVKPVPALVGAYTKGSLAQELQGLNIESVKAHLLVNEQKIAEATGDMLFTHYGLSGPAVLAISRYIPSALEDHKNVSVVLDLKPELQEDQLDAQMRKDLNEHGKKQVNNLLRYWLPASIIPVALKMLRIDGEKESHQLKGDERRLLRRLIKHFEFEVTDTLGFKEAIVTAGGVSLEQVDPKTMESKLIKGLHFAGEVLDLDAQTGGYNLQIAYSTGWVAGNS